MSAPKDKSDPLRDVDLDKDMPLDQAAGSNVKGGQGDDDPEGDRGKGGAGK